MSDDNTPEPTQTEPEVPAEDEDKTKQTPEGDPPAEPEKETPEEEPKEDPKAEEPEEGADDPEEDDAAADEDEPDAKDSDYEEYSDPALKQAVSILKEAKIPVEETNAIFKEAVDAGDFSKVNKEALVEKLGDEKAELVLVLAESYYTKEFAQFEKKREAVYDIVGGEENFTAMRDWAKQKAEKDPEFATELQEIRSMMEGSPRAVKAAAKELFDLYRQDPDTTIPADLTKGDKPGSASGVSPLGRREYIDELEKAQRNGTYEKVKSSLWARRQAGMKKGI